MGSIARVVTSVVLLWAAVVMPSRAGAGLVPCSATDLINAVQAAVTAGGPQTIGLSPACTYTLTAVHTGAGTANASGLPFINNMTTAPVVLTINGNGATITRDNGAPQFRFFLVFQNNSLALNNLTLSNGKAADNAAPGGATGGAIANGGTLTLTAVALTGNAAGDGVGTGSTGGSGGALSNSGSASIVSSTINNNSAGDGGGTGATPGIGGFGGGIVNFGTLEITSTLLNGNTAGDGGMGAGGPGATGGGGGAISNSGMLTVLACNVNSNFAGNGGASTTSTGGSGGPGGGIANNTGGTISLSNTTVSSNTAGSGGSGQTGGAGATGGGVHNQGTMATVSSVTISDNAAGNGGNGTTTGGAGGNGGGLALFGTSTTTVVNSTISTNIAGDAGSGGTPAGGAGGGLFNAAFGVSVTNCTITGNGAAIGGGIRVPGAGIPQLRNTIVAGNSPGESCSGSIGNVNNNLDSGTSCGFGSTNGSISNGNANLGPLQDNGGFTFTHTLLDPSDAIDAGNDAVCTAPPVSGGDQRGVGRPQGAHCDIGAFETGAAPATATSTGTATITATAAVTPTATATPTVTLPPVSCAGPADGRISCWKAEGNADDSVDDNDGTLLGETTFAEGIDGQAFSFDGAGDFVNIPDAADVDFDPTDPITISAWAYRESNNPTMGIIGKRPGCSGAPANYEIGLDQASGAGLNWGRQGAAVVTQTDLPLNAWTHLVGTFDGTTLRMYINGVQAGSLPGTLAMPNDVPLLFGGTGSCPSFGGRLDEIQLYQRALTSTEVMEIYEAYVPRDPCQGPSNGRISCWRGEGNAIDSAGDNDGTLQNGVTFVPGRIDQAFHFNRATQFVQTTDAPDLDFERTDPFSINAWVRTSETAHNIFIATKQPNSSPFKGYGIVISNGEAPACDASNPTAPGAGQLVAFLDGELSAACPPDKYISVRGTAHLNDGQWHHVAMTYDGTSSAAGVKLYVDGAPEGGVVQSDTLGSNTILNNVPFTIGSRANGGVPYNGDIDEVQVFNRVLSAAEILQIYNAAPPLPTATPTVTQTGLPTLTASATATNTLTATNTAAETPTATATPSTSNTPTNSVTATMPATATATATISPTHSVTVSPTPTRTPSTAPTASATVSPTPPAGFVTIVGQVLRPRRQGTPVIRGQEAVPNAPVSVFRCELMRRRVCLKMPGSAVASGVTDTRGLFFLQIPVALLSDGVFVISATIDGVTLTELRKLIVILVGPGAGSGAGVLDEIVVDVVSEAGVLLLDEEGLENFADEGVAEVLAAVDLANEDANFDGVGDEEAVAAALTTAEADPGVQAAVEANRQIPCGGDCDAGGTVTVDEIIRGVNIALGTTPVGNCIAFDIDDSDSVTVDEIVTAVNNALSGCS